MQVKNENEITNEVLAQRILREKIEIEMTFSRHAKSISALNDNMMRVTEVNMSTLKSMNNVLNAVAALGVMVVMLFCMVLFT
jgi:hypothetical protein